MDSTSIVRIDQVIHGYDRGHKELAASVELDEKSRETMLILSDLLTEEGLEAGGSYLTCYPLRSAARHVLARTWPAGPAFRPGSVWTHSLVLDYKALALISDLVALLPLLTYPGERNRIRTVDPLFFDAKSLTNSIAISSSADAAIAGIYNVAAPREVLALPRGQSEDELLALALWRQMWPGLRRDFAFLTGQGTIPTQVEAACVLRFTIEAKRSEQACKEDLSVGQRQILLDLPITGPTPLRRFLSRYAIEAREPRSVASLLAEIWSQLDKTSLDAKLRAISKLTQGNPLPRLVRDLISLEFARISNGEELLLLMREFRDADIDVDITGPLRVARGLPASELKVLLAETAETNLGKLGAKLFAAILRSFDLNLLSAAADGLERLPMLQIRPELATQRAFWPEEDEKRGLLIEAADPEITLNLDSGVNLFGALIGPRTVHALLNRSTNQTVATVKTLLIQGEPNVRQIIARRIIKKSSLLCEVLELGDGSNDILDEISEAIIAEKFVKFDHSVWSFSAEKTMEMFNSTHHFSESTLIVSCVACFLTGGSAGLRLAKGFYDPVQYLITRNRLTRSQENFLEATLPAKGWNLRVRLIRSAVDVWPPSHSYAGALRVSEDRDNVKDLLDEIMSRFSQNTLKNCATDPQISSEAVRQIARICERNKFRWWL